ncbi:hypothetical protein SO3561_09497 [Streptomyces olivochromogenes]|uniref:Transposase n=1 Tax=Streptomyces olivochromogenes TaxID=1963 RepID=A0A250VV08_STROL|nr:hypothetical protein SO3561_09497 [Streptomyces olivochromogenes]
MKAAAWDFISAHAETFGIKRICRVLEVSRSGYYRWIAGPTRHPHKICTPNGS